MPLTAKGKKLKKKFEEQYGKKKGQSVFYAMESSGKLKKVVKKRIGGVGGRAKEGPVERGAVRAGSQYSKNKAKEALEAQRKQTIKQLTPRSQTIGGRLLTAGLTLSGVPFAGTVTSKLMDKPYWERSTKTTTKDKTFKEGPQRRVEQVVTPIQATKPVDPNLVSPKENFFNFTTYKVGGLSGGVSYGPPPKKGPNSQVPPVKMKKGGYKK